MKYSSGFRSRIIQKVLSNGGAVSRVAKETGVSYITIKGWLAKHKDGNLDPGDGSDDLLPSQRSPVEKLGLLLEGRALSDDQRGEWLRQHGLHTEHLTLWEQELGTMMNDKQVELNAENAALKKENRKLQKELERKEKALAEAAILLTLKKKHRHLFQDEGL
jgi:transposase